MERRSVRNLVGASGAIACAFATSCARDAQPEPVEETAFAVFADESTLAKDKLADLERLDGLDRGGRLAAGVLAAPGLERWRSGEGHWDAVRARIVTELWNDVERIAARPDSQRERVALVAAANAWLHGVDRPGEAWRPGLDLLLPASTAVHPVAPPADADLPVLVGARVTDARGAELWRRGDVASGSAAGVRQWSLSVGGTPPVERGTATVYLRPSSLGAASFAEALDAGGVAAARMLATSRGGPWDDSPALSAAASEDVDRQIKERLAQIADPGARQRVAKACAEWRQGGRSSDRAARFGFGALLAARSTGLGFAASRRDRAGGAALVTADESTMAKEGEIPDTPKTPIRAVGDTQVFEALGGSAVRVYTHPVLDTEGVVRGTAYVALDARAPTDLGPVSGAADPDAIGTAKAVFGALKSGEAASFVSLLPTPDELCILETGAPLPSRDETFPDSDEAIRRRMRDAAAEIAARTRAAVRAAARDAADDFCVWTTSEFDAAKVESLALRGGRLEETISFRIRSERRAYVFMVDGLIRVGDRWVFRGAGVPGGEGADVVRGGVRHSPVARGSWLAAVLEQPATAAIQAIKSANPALLDPFSAREADYRWALFHARKPLWVEADRYPRRGIAEAEVATARRLEAGSRTRGDGDDKLDWNRVRFGGINPEKSSVTTGEDGLRHADLVLDATDGEARVAVTLAGCFRVDRGWVVQALEEKGR